MSTLSLDEAHDLTDIRVEEARALKARATGSARAVLILIAIVAAMMVAAGLWRMAIIWGLLTALMVGVTVVYARFAAPHGITRETVGRYLRGHLIITACTGLLWGGFAIASTDIQSELHVVLSIYFLTSITLGGMMAGAVYRPAYVALLCTALLPFAAHLLLNGEGLIQILGIGLLAYFAFGYTTNAAADQRTRETMAARINRDATRRIIEQSREIERLNAERGRFMASISHDMAQPLLAQRHFVAALRDISDAPKQRHLLDQIQRVQQSQEHLLRELVSFSQLERDVVLADPEVCSLRGLAEDVLAEWQSALAQKAITADVVGPEGLVETDPHLVRRILRNFLSNAAKYAGQGGRLRLTVRVGEGGASVTVSDSGPGIAEPDRARAFEEYVRLDASDRVQGLGLGLSISDRLARLIGADITMDTSEFGGLAVSLTVPPEALREAGGETVPPVRQAPLVLVVGAEDHGAFGSWADLVSSWAWRFVSAETLEAAERLLAILHTTPDVVIYDRPDCAGPALAARVTAAIGPMPAGMAPATLALPAQIPPKELRGALDAALAEAEERAQMIPSS